jgi:hypothetical protein
VRLRGISSARLAEELPGAHPSETVRQRIPDLTEDEMRDVVGYVDNVVRRRDMGGGW